MDNAAFCTASVTSLWGARDYFMSPAAGDWSSESTHETYLTGMPHIVGVLSMSMPAATGLGRGEGSLDAGGRRGVNRGLRRVGDGVAEKRSCVTGDGVVERATGDER